MATTRIMPLHVGKGRTESRAISDIIDYVANPQKTDGGKLITGFACDSRTADAEFLLAKRQYIAATGRVRGKDDVIAYHVRQSFMPGEITPEEANRLGVEFAKRFTKGKHAFVVCTHIDKAHVHNHIIWSSVTLDCDRKFRNFWGSTKAVRQLSDTICIENGLSIVENPKPHGKSYNKWLGDQAKPSHRELLRMAIDQALAQKPADLDALFQLLQDAGCEVSKRGKSYRLKLPSWDRVARLDSLGEGYTLDDLLAVLSGQKEHTPRKKSVVRAAPPKVNLLVDIQAKLQAGKGAGYSHAKLHHIKKENIGLIEVMGLAVLPARLKAELAAVADKLVSGGDLREDPLTAAHADWAEGFAPNYTFTADNAMDIVRKETGLVFAQVLECAGVYKRTPEGQAAFLRFIQQV